jgi:hypothetical protein
MTRQIEAPDDEEAVWIAEQLVAAAQLVERCGGKALTGGLADLHEIQFAVDELGSDDQSKNDAYALGLAFGQVFLENHSGFDWWMVEDEYGRDVALQFGNRTFLIFPGSMFSNRHEDGENIRVSILFADLAREVDALRPNLGADV